MATALITYFGAFEGVELNPTQTVAERARELLAHSASHLTVQLEELPVTFAGSGTALHTVISQHQPQIIISTGIAVGRRLVSIERLAINCDDARIADNEGTKPQDTEIVPGGPAAYFSGLPYRAIHTAAKADNLPVEISNSAGTYVCNHVFYELMHTLTGTKVPGGFIHIPAISSEETRESDFTAHQDAGGIEETEVPTQPLDLVARVLEIAVLETLKALS